MSEKSHQKSKRISKVLQSFTKEDMHQLGVTTTTTPLIRLDNNNRNNNNNNININHHHQQQQQQQAQPAPQGHNDHIRSEFHSDDIMRNEEKGNNIPHIHTDLGFSTYHKNLIDSTMNAAAASQVDRSRGQQLIYLYPLASPRDGYPSPTEMSSTDTRYSNHPNLQHHQQSQQSQHHHIHHHQQQQQQQHSQHNQHQSHPQQQQQQSQQQQVQTHTQTQTQHLQQVQHPTQSPSVETYYSYSPQVFYSPPQTYYSGSRPYTHLPNMSPYYPLSPHQGTFFPPQSNSTQNPVTIYVPPSPYQTNNNSNFTGVSINETYSSLLPGNETQFSYSNNNSNNNNIINNNNNNIINNNNNNNININNNSNNQRQSNFPVNSNVYLNNPPTPPTPTRRSPPAGTRNGPQQQRSQNSNGSKKSKNKSKPVEQNYNTLNTYHGRILEIAVDQAKCRELQSYLRDGGTDGTTNYSPSQVLLLIFDDICQQAFPIVVNPFGNYLFQKVYEYSNHEQRIHLLHALSPRLADASCNKHGSRCVQDMIKNSIEYPDLINIIVQTLITQILRLCVDENGNHVVQFCLEKLTVEQNSFIFNLIIERCLDICKQRYGNRVMQKCIKCAVEGQCQDFTPQIVDHSLDLITDEFGNYIIQHMLQTCPQHVHSICCAVVGSITVLSKQKHASVVIEKCFQSAGYDVQRRYLEEIIVLDNLQTLIEDQFGNYVIQNALKYLPSDLKHKLVEHLLKFIDVIKQMPWGLQIISKMCSDSAVMSPSQSNNTNINNTITATASPNININSNVNLNVNAHNNIANCIQTPTATVPNSSL